MKASSVKTAPFDYLASLEWITARENVGLVGTAGTGRSHLLVALGHAAVDAGHRVGYFTAAELVETLYRGLADNSVARVIEQILKADVILITRSASPHSMTPARNCASGSSPLPTNDDYSASDPTGRSKSGAGSFPNTPPQSASTGSSTTPSWSPPTANRSA